MAWVACLVLPTWIFYTLWNFISEWWNSHKGVDKDVEPTPAPECGAAKMEESENMLKSADDPKLNPASCMEPAPAEEKKMK